MFRLQRGRLVSYQVVPAWRLTVQVTERERRGLDRALEEIPVLSRVHSSPGRRVILVSEPECRRAVATVLARAPGARLESKLTLHELRCEVPSRLRSVEPVTTRRLHAALYWNLLPVPRGRAPLVLDAGNAFGNLTHPSTRLALGVLDRVLAERPGASVLDVGCGTGALAIGARLLGAQKVVGVDLEPQAIDEARRNAAHNGVEVELRAGSVTELQEPYDVVAANLYPEGLLALASRVGALTRHRAIIAGFHTEQLPSVLDAFRGTGLEVVRTASQVAMLGGRRRTWLCCELAR